MKRPEKGPQSREIVHKKKTFCENSYYQTVKPKEPKINVLNRKKMLINFHYKDDVTCFCRP